jgi:AcrR family transcriptional regulator
MATRDPDAKRRQLMEAAMTEFAAHGIAGARMDRIAQRAGCSAGLVYTYFGGKDELFDAVFDAAVVRTVTEIPITPDDLPGYAVALYDAQEAHPEVLRISAWQSLERSTAGEPAPAVAAATAEKTAAIAAAQEAGTVSRRFTPDHLMLLVITMASMFSMPGLPSGAANRDHRRSTIHEAVRRLVEP